MKKIKNKIYKFLKWTEKWTKTDMIYLAKGNFWLSSSLFIASFISFLMAIVFANLLSPYDYGNYKYILSVIGLLSITTLPGMNTAVTKSVAQGKEGIIKKALITKIKWGLIGGLISLIIGIYYYSHHNILFASIFLSASFFIPLMNSFKIYSGLITGRKIFKIGTLSTIIVNFICSALITISLLITKNIFYITLVYMSSYTLSRAFTYIFLNKKLKPNKVIDKETIKYGKQLSFIQYLGSIAGRIDGIIIFQILGPINLAIYSFSTVLPNKISAFIGNSSSLALPKFSENNPSETKKTLTKKIIKLELLLLPIIIVYIILVPFFFKIFFPQYLDSIKYTDLYVLNILYAPLNIIVSYLKSQKKVNTLLKMQTITPTLRIILLLLLAYPFGIYGVIFAMLISRIINFTLAFYLYYKE